MKNSKTVGPSINRIEPFFLSEYYENNECSILYIGKDEREISKIKKKIDWLLPDTQTLLFLAWDQIPYDQVSPSKQTQIERLETLNSLINNQSKKIILTTVNSIIQKVIPNEIIKQNSLSLIVNQKIIFNNIINSLTLLGFQ